jgi:tryptophan synthase alpha chain
MADGPIIQAAAKRALQAGVKVADILSMVRAFRVEDDHTPIILMGYLNPILSYGPERFCIDAAGAGADGLIIVDLPPEEADLLLPYSDASGLDFIRLVAPTTNDERLPHVLQGSSGFVYYVAITGITGTRSASSADLAEAVPRIRRATDLPIAIGFGVRTPAQAAEASRVADAAVVASALIDTLAANLDVDGKPLPGMVGKVLDQVRGLAEAVRGTSRA